MSRLRFNSVVYPDTDVRVFGAIGNYIPSLVGVTDDTAAIQAALNAVGVGGTAYLPRGRIFYVAGNLTIPHNVTLKGPQSHVGTMTSNSLSSLYHTMGGAIALKSTATITMNAGSCLDGVLIVQSGLTFPTTDATGFAGTAITYAGDDCTVQNSMILGFAQGITSTNFQRPKVFDCLMDNLSGIAFAGSQDVTHIERVHMWNFATFYPAVPGNDLQRSGTAFSVTQDGSGAKLIDCFCYGYNTGFNMSGTGEVGQTLLNCWADGTGAGFPFGTGFNITSGATDTKLTGCQASGVITGYLFSMSAGLKATMTDCNAWGNTTHGILSGSGNAGDVIVRGGYLRNNSNAISYANTGGAGILDVDEVAFDSSNGLTFNISVSSTSIRIGNLNSYGNVAAGTALIGTGTNVALPSIASAGVVSLPNTGSDFLITGTFVGLGTLNYGWAGRVVTLFFASAGCQVNNSTGAYTAMRLSGAAAYTSTAGSTLTLKHNGVQWFEVGRSA